MTSLPEADGAIGDRRSATALAQAVRACELANRAVELRDKCVQLSLDCGVRPADLAAALGVNEWVVQEIARRAQASVR
jgi:hypothetical protein